MAEKRAEEIIMLYDKELARASNFRNLYQNTADLMLPRENQIIQKSYPGTEKTTHLHDTTGVTALQDMASGLSVNLFPPGQRFYNIVMSDRDLNEIEIVKRTLSIITDVSHAKRAASNFMLQANETLKSICGFGTGNMYSEWVPGLGLNYRDYDIGFYLILENSKGRIDGMLMKFPYTARQAVQEYGYDNVGGTIREKYKDEKTREEKFEFIHIVRPRTDGNRLLSDNLNMPWESILVAVKEKIIIRGINPEGKLNEAGFPEFPYHVPRWTKSSNEKFGRGQGTFILPVVRSLQVMDSDLVECGNKWNNPPREVLESFEGEVSVIPGALNWVQTIPSIKAIDEGIRGNFPLTKDIIEYKQEIVKKAFYNDIFILLANLKGDRRTTLEIRERLAEGLQRLGPSVGRLWEEWLNPLVIRDVMLLLRNGELPPLPPEMQGKAFKIEFLGRLAMELKSQQAQGFLRWVGYGAEMEATFPGTKDNVNVDKGYRRLGEILGVNVEDIATLEEVDAKREARAAELQRQQALELAQLAGTGYQQTSQKAEEGSPAGELMEALK